MNKLDREKETNPERYKLRMLMRDSKTAKEKAKWKREFRKTRSQGAYL